MPIKNKTMAFNKVIDLDKKRTKIISNYVKKHNPISKKITYVIEDGTSVEKTAFTIPRSFLRLNPFNHRFQTSVSELIEERLQEKKSPDFNLDSKYDVEQLRNMLRGIYPINPDRKTNYDKLLNEIKNHSEIHGGNGLRDACIVTADGTFVNGNRRDTVLEDLQNLETKKKNGGDPSKFDKIDVVICSENTTYSDIRQMEIKEQVSTSLRDEYDFMNTALLIKEEYDNLLAQKGDEKKDQVIKIIASRVEGKQSSAIKEYLEFLEFVDAILETLKLDGEYHKINTKIPGESKPVTTILREWQNRWYNEKSGTRKFLIVNIAAGYCQGVFKTAKNPGDESVYKYTARNHREFKNYEKSKKAKAILEDINYWKKHDFTSDKSADELGDLIQKAEEYKKNELWITKPAKVLDSVNSSLLTIDDALVGTRSKEVKSLLEQANVTRYLSEFRKIISNIENKLSKMPKTK